MDCRNCIWFKKIRMLLPKAYVCEVAKKLLLLDEYTICDKFEHLDFPANEKVTK